MLFRKLIAGKKHCVKGDVMKKFVSIFMSIVIFATFSCSGKDNKGSGGGSLSAPGVKDTAPMKYLQYMYSDEAGKSLNDKVSASYQDVYNNEIIRQKVNQYLSVGFIEEMNQAQTRGGKNGSNWWEKIDVDPEKIAQYLSSPEGKQAFIDRLDGGVKAPGHRFIEEIIITIAEAAASWIFSSMSEQDAASQYAEYFSDVVNIELLILIRLGQIQEEQEKMKNEILDKMAEGFVGLANLIKVEAFKDAEAGLNAAVTSVKGFLTEISTIQGVDNQYRNDMIKDYILKGYETMYQAAYDSSVEKLKAINNLLADGNRVPFNMLFSDMIFMRELSMLRIAFASTVFSGQDLLEYRSNVSAKDLLRLKDIKKSLYRAAITADLQTYANEVAAFLMS
jgi:hypothetical protein